jgi:hypothetical protein
MNKTQSNPTTETASPTIHNQQFPAPLVVSESTFFTVLSSQPQRAKPSTQTQVRNASQNEVFLGR